MKRKKLGQLLIDAGKIDEQNLQDAISYQKIHNCKIGQALAELGYITDKEIIGTLSTQLKIPMVDLNKQNLHSKGHIVRSIPESVARKYMVIPINMDMEHITIASANPFSLDAVDDIAFITKKKVILHLCDEESIERAIDRYYREESERALEELKKEFSEIDLDHNTEADDITQAPTVRLVNSIIRQSIKMHASDIHIEPFETEVLVRARIDGVLQRIMTIPHQSYSAVCTRFKLLADMNIAEKRVPQDGRIKKELEGKKYDLRVSSLPTAFGEKLVLRILHRSADLLDVHALGFTDGEMEKIQRFMRIPYGIILVSGPTGSGKTTTLYAILSAINEESRNLVTVEDPIEYMFQGINQVQVNHRAGLTFAAGLRSILRQDPDVIMVGEIRDEETGEIAVRSAITGHMVLSTIHTNDSTSTVTRLLDMGIPSYLVADALVGVIAQRLMRRLCPFCKESYMSQPYEMKLLGLPGPVELSRAKGCPQCNQSGYKGRMAVHEILEIDDQLRQAIVDGESSSSIKLQAVNNGMVTLYTQSKHLVLQQITSVDELTKTVFI